MLLDFGPFIETFFQEITIYTVPLVIEEDEVVPGTPIPHTVRGAVFPADTVLSSLSGVQLRQLPLEAGDYLLFVRSPITDVEGNPVTIDLLPEGEEGHNYVRVGEDYFTIVKEYADYSTLGGFIGYVMKRTPKPLQLEG